MWYFQTGFGLSLDERKQTNFHTREGDWNNVTPANTVASKVREWADVNTSEDSKSKQLQGEIKTPPRKATRGRNVQEKAEAIKK